MVTPLSLQNVSFILNNGHTLFQNITAQFHQSISGLVGANGVGKSVLAKLLAKQLTPSTGFITSPTITAYIPQQWSGSANDSIATVLKLAKPLEAMNRIANGSCELSDFELAEPYWDWQTRLTDALNTVGFPVELDLSRTISSFSGGEQFRLMWAAALLQNPDAYIFDEPTNHLDSEGKACLTHWLTNRTQPIILVTHDRYLLQQVNAIFELTPNQIYHHPGDYEQYYRAQLERWNQQEKNVLTARKQKRQRAIKAQESFEKQQQRVAKGKAKAKRENWSVLEKNAAKEAGENTQHNETKLRENRESAAQKNTQLAESNREWFEPIGFELPGSEITNKRTILTAEDYITGYDTPLHQPLTLELHGAFKLHIVGSNGTGKSALLKTFMQEQPPWQGLTKIHVPCAYLGQHFYEFDDAKTAVENFLHHQPLMTEKEGRDRLAWLRLRNTKADVLFANLSGGEQLKVVLASKLLGAITPQLLLLDEPTNHLDLDSIIALDNALSAFKGALIIVSHDQYFVSQQQITHRLTLDNKQYKLDLL